jgi:hypothetical protein
MGSGCTNSSLKNICPIVTTSNCTIWQGEAVPLLGICTGDTLTEVETAVITKLLTITDGTGIELSSITPGCTFMSQQLIGKDKTLDVLLQVLFDSNCTLKQLVDNLTTQINTPYNYDPKCLAPGTYTTESLLQAVVNEVCDLKSQVDNLTSQLENGNLAQTIDNRVGNYIGTHIWSNQNKGTIVTGSGSSTSVQIVGFVPLFTPQWSYAPLSNFDSSGKGIPGTYMDGWYICNGFNNTPDMRGYTAAGATSLPGINGNTLIYQVNPTAQNDPDINTAILDRKGDYKVQLTVPQMPSHNHSASDSGHTHSTNTGGAFQPAGGSNTSNYTSQVNNQSSQTGTGYANVSIGSTGGNQKHENRPPTIYGYWIVRTY